MDYGQTLNLPQTEFPMRGNLPQREPEQLAKWYAQKIDQRRREVRAGKEKFVLHDGPPYANGNIHIGHALNKILKDIIVKYHYMQGYDTPYVPGWDTHGLPIEHAAVKILGLNRHELDPLDLRKQCKEYALKYVDIQREEFKRLGILGDWDNPYITLVPSYEGAQIRVFGAMAKNGHIYKGLKTVYWCPSCETALAEAEIEYQEKKSHSIYVKFPLVDAHGKMPADLPNLPVYAVIWTTTPWTMPANVAMSAHPDFTYVWVLAGEEIYVVAEELLPGVAEVAKGEGWQILARQKGEELEGIEFQHPFLERMSPIILGDHVTLEAGTGLVHTAPGHGQEDFEIGQKYGLPVINPVDHAGKFTAEGGVFEGLYVEDANVPVIKLLAEKGRLLGKASIRHQYPHCWRCKSPVIYRATEQWFASVEGFRKEALEAIESVKWIPSWGKDRIHNMVADRQDWCISRQRVWGVPIPIFYCKSCNESIVTDDTIDAVATRFTVEGSDAWWAHSAEELLPKDFSCPHCHKSEGFRKETDIMDVWFDSGSSHAAVCEVRPELTYPADMYLEGSDQHRGWFQSSLLTSVATKGQAPFKAVLTHGFVMDGDGRKMSKSLGNTVSPQDVTEKYGADILRLWVSSADYKADIRISQEIIKQLSDNYRKIRNTFRFLMANLYDFNSETDKVAYADLLEIDRWALLRLEQVADRVTQSYETYDFHQMFHTVHNFCAVDLSAIYLDITKDRTYASAPESLKRRAAQTVMHETLHVLLGLVAPVLSFTADEVWSHLPQKGNLESVHLSDWPTVSTSYRDEALEKKWEKLLTLRGEVTKSLEITRQKKEIGNSVDAGLDLYLDAEWKNFVAESKISLEELCIVSEVVLKDFENLPEEAFKSSELNLGVVVRKPEGSKCERCWLTLPSVGINENHSTLCDRCGQVLQGK